MGYHIYTTDGIVLKRKVFGEADVLLFILTKDLGLISASAKSARLEISKLKGSLQEYQFVTISCVHGKNGWKITSVADKGSFYFNFPETHRKVLVQISDLLLQMITGELVHQEIFETVKTGYEYLATIKSEEIANLETLLVLRILHELGYVAKDSEIFEFTKNPTYWSEELLLEVEKSKKNIILMINKGIKESHL